jgi:hypothetical protein
MQRVEDTKIRFRAGRGGLLALAAILGVAGIVAVLLVTTPGTLQSGVVTGSASAVPNPLAISALPNSWAVAKDPLKSGSASSVQPGGPITIGDSKSNCISMDLPSGVLSQSAISALTELTGVTYNCLEVYANPMPTWGEWETPWMFSSASYGWDAWLAASPAHQVVMAMDLIPKSLSDNNDPLTWEETCAAGNYNQYATTLAENLVSYGAGNIIIRLGLEANGEWEADYAGKTTAEENDWAKCYDNEVTAMRAVPGAHFVFVWNPNACAHYLPLDEWYPGNSYVDIIGVDAYDTDCATYDSVSQEGWEAFFTDSYSTGSSDLNFPSLANIEAFAVAHGKPLSFPEWGVTSDDASYISNMAQMFYSDDFAFEGYFDTGDGVDQLGSSIPKATAAYSKAFK